MTKPKKRVSLHLPVQVYNQVKQAAKRQGISLAEYGSLAMVWYFANSESRRPAYSAGYRGRPHRRKTS